MAALNFIAFLPFSSFLFVSLSLSLCISLSLSLSLSVSLFLDQLNGRLELHRFLALLLLGEKQTHGLLCNGYGVTE
jgi:hypothetical protein